MSLNLTELASNAPKAAFRNSPGVCTNKHQSAQTSRIHNPLHSLQPHMGWNTPYFSFDAYRPTSTSRSATEAKSYLP